MCKTIFGLLPAPGSVSLSKTVAGFASARELHVRDIGEPALYPPSSGARDSLYGELLHSRQTTNSGGDIPLSACKLSCNSRVHMENRG